jgi:hypothetical protein
MGDEADRLWSATLKEEPNDSLWVEAYGRIFREAIDRVTGTVASAVLGDRLAVLDGKFKEIHRKEDKSNAIYIVKDAFSWRNLETTEPESGAT